MLTSKIIGWQSKKVYLYILQEVCMESLLNRNLGDFTRSGLEIHFEIKYQVKLNFGIYVAKNLILKHVNQLECMEILFLFFNYELKNKKYGFLLC